MSAIGPTLVGVGCTVDYCNRHASPLYGRGLSSACLLGLLLLFGGCTGKAEAVRAAQPHLENFADLRCGR